MILAYLDLFLCDDLVIVVLCSVDLIQGSVVEKHSLKQMRIWNLVTQYYKANCNTKGEYYLSDGMCELKHTGEVINL
jgi:hypothetical protein